MPASILVLNLAVLFAVLESDLGTRKVGTFRVVRPLLMAIGIVPLFIGRPATAGSGAVLELALTGVGILIGLIASGWLMRVHYDGTRHQVVSRAGVSYGLFWTAVIGLRILFTYGANHWYAAQLVHWMTANGISAGALTDGLIFMALGMTLTRTLRLIVGKAQIRTSGAKKLAVQS
jgi:hypothetical protein